MMNNISEASIILEGIVSVEAAIKAGLRTINKVFIDIEKHKKRDRKITRFVSFLKENSITFELCEREYINSFTDGNTHGGVIADVSERSYSSLPDLVSSLQTGEYLVMLDGVEDPFNFGYSIRNLFAFGCRGFIVPERNWMSSAGVVAKSSAGSSEMCSMAISHSDDELVELLKAKGIDIVCSALSHDSISLFEFRPERPFVLFIGGEKRGISNTFIDNANKIVHIPYSREAAKYSLPTASCAAIFGSFLSSLN